MMKCSAHDILCRFASQTVFVLCKVNQAVQNYCDLVKMPGDPLFFEQYIKHRKGDQIYT